MLKKTHIFLLRLSNVFLYSLTSIIIIFFIFIWWYYLYSPIKTKIYFYKSEVELLKKQDLENENHYLDAIKYNKLNPLEITKIKLLQQFNNIKIEQRLSSFIDCLGKYEINLKSCKPINKNKDSESFYYFFHTYGQYEDYIKFFNKISQENYLIKYIKLDIKKIDNQILQSKFLIKFICDKQIGGINA